MSGHDDRPVDPADEAFARRLDQGLCEVLGGERAPDVLEVVLARAAGDGMATRVAPPSRQSWWIAAALLLGAFAVVGVALLQRRAVEAPDEVVAQDPTEKLLEVTSAATIASLPVDLRAVELRNLDDAAVAALVARCPRLEHLRVYASIVGRRVDDGPAVSITDEALPVIARLDRLRTLELLATQDVKGTTLRELERLPLLTRLRLSYFDLDGDALQFLSRLPSLRSLTMELNMRLDADGIAALGQCVGLQELLLRSCRGAPPNAWQPLARLRSLRVLDLSGVGVMHRGVADEATARRWPPFVPPSDPGSRIVADSLQDWPRLARLHLAHAPVAADFAQVLRTKCPELRELDLGYCPNVDDTTIAACLALPSLRVLRLADCPGVGQASIARLLASSLRTIDFGTWAQNPNPNSDWLTLEHVEALLRSGKRVEWLPPEDRRAGFAALRERYAATYERPELVRTLAELEALPDDVPRVECRDLGDRAAALLAKRPRLVAVEFVNDAPDDRLTGRGLAAVCALPKLESLRLLNLGELRSADLRSLGTMQSLRELECVAIAFDDDALQALPAAARLEELSLLAIRGFGERGMAAIARCANLRRLELPDCTQLDSKALAHVGALQRLVELDLSGNPGLRDAAMMPLQNCTALRKLNVAEGGFTSMGLQALTNLRELAVLDVSGNPDLVAGALQYVPVTVTELVLDRCAGLDATAAARLRDRFVALRELRVGQNAWVTDDVLRTLVERPSLERLGLLRCDQLTNASFATIRAARSLRFVDCNGTACVTKEQAETLRVERPELEVVRFVW